MTRTLRMHAEHDRQQPLEYVFLIYTSSPHDNHLYNNIVTLLNIEIDYFGNYSSWPINTPMTTNLLLLWKMERNWIMTSWISFLSNINRTLIFYVWYIDIHSHISIVQRLMIKHHPLTNNDWQDAYLLHQNAWLLVVSVVPFGIKVWVKFYQAWM